MPGDNGYSAAYAKCPFYQRDSKKPPRIVCEGITDDNYLILSFGKNPRARDKHKRIFCDAAYEHCEIYRMLTEKYEEE